MAGAELTRPQNVSSFRRPCGTESSLGARIDRQPVVAQASRIAVYAQRRICQEAEVVAWSQGQALAEVAA